MYSWVSVGVKLAATSALLLCAAGSLAQSGTYPPPLACSGRLTALFTPVRPQQGRYEACTTNLPLAGVVQPGWTVEMVPPLDAFGNAGLVDRPTLARLYGGQRALVARGWVEQDGRFEAVTLISPHPNVQLSALEPGTLVVRYFVIE